MHKNVCTTDYLRETVIYINKSEKAFEVAKIGDYGTDRSYLETAHYRNIRDTKIDIMQSATITIVTATS